MRRAILVTCLSAAAIATVAGCGRTVVRETVVERPVVQRETVIQQQPTVLRETIVQSPASCMLGTAPYASGTFSCQSGYRYQCNNGAWERIAGSYC